MIRGAVTNESDYWKRTQSQEYYAPLERPHSQPPPNMILQNGYGELDRPDPTQKDERRMGTPNGYSRYSYEQEGEWGKRRLLINRSMKTKNKKKSGKIGFVSYKMISADG